MNSNIKDSNLQQLNELSAIENERFDKCIDRLIKYVENKNDNDQWTLQDKEIFKLISQKAKRHSFTYFLIVIVLTIFVVLSFGTCLYFYGSRQQQQFQLNAKKQIIDQMTKGFLPLALKNDQESGILVNFNIKDPKYKDMIEGVEGVKEEIKKLGRHYGLGSQENLKLARKKDDGAKFSESINL